MLRRVVSASATFLALSFTLFLGGGCVQTVTVGTPAAPRFGTDLLSGAEWEYSTDRGTTWSRRVPIVRSGQKAPVYARASFKVDDPSRYVALELSHGLPARQRMFFRINGKLVVPPEKGMYYRTIPAIPPDLLRVGTNVLEAKLGYDNRPPPQSPRRMPTVHVALKPLLVGLEPRHLRISSGPILGVVEKDFFAVTCRTNMPAKMEVYRHAHGGGQLTFVTDSPPGLIHRLRVQRQQEGADGCYVLVADNGRHARAEVIRAADYPKAGEPFRFIGMGDSRTNPDDWAAVAAAALKERPDLVVFSGDMVSRGRNDWEWDEEYFGPAKDFFANIPYYAVIGNHEEDAPLYPKLFYTPSPDGTARHWIQEINGVLLIGIDGRDDWSVESENVEWLEGILQLSQARFIFLFSHYPAWSSSSHGRLREETGRPREREVREAQDAIVPLLVRYRATAYVCGHDHCYERSELPGGLSHVISGGAGAPLRTKAAEAEIQNPYSAVFARTLHYCLFEITGNTCTMKAITPEGEMIDTRSWTARELKLSASPAAKASPAPSN